MPDLPFPYGPLLPLDASPVSCWRCGGPTGQRQGLLRFDPCETCVQMLREIARCYQGRPEGEDTRKGGPDALYV